MHQSHLSLVVVVGLMPGAAIIPKGDRARQPVEAAGELWFCNMGIEFVE